MSNVLIGSQKTYPASLLLKFDGVNNSTTFTDSSKYNHTVTAYGNTCLKTAQSKSGGSSASFDGTGDYLIYSNGKSNFNLFNSITTPGKIFIPGELLCH